MVAIIKAIANDEGIPAGFPILVDRDMAIVEPAFAYLIERAMIPGRGRRTETIRTYAEHLHDWFDSLEQSGIDWRDVDERTIAAYRNRMLEQPSPHTGRPYARATINGRVRSVCRFYEWAQRRGWIAELAFHEIDIRIIAGHKQSFLVHADPRPAVTKANVLTLAEHERLPRPLRADQIERLLANLSMPYRLMAEWALTTGLRRMELCALTLGQVPNTATLDVADHPLIGVPLAVTKGDRPRTVYAPIRLVDRTHWYVGEDRAVLVRRVRAGRHGYHPPVNLFLNRHGRGIAPARVTAAFAEAFRAAGLDGSLHWLRHTFAMSMLILLQAQTAAKPELNPLKVLQVLLGHSSIQTTAIYLRCVELHEHEVAASLDYLYGSVIQDAA